MCIYRVNVYPHDTSKHNPVHEAINLSTVCILRLEIGQRCWFESKVENDNVPHRICTSVVKDIIRSEETKSVLVTTENTTYLFEEILNRA